MDRIQRPFVAAAATMVLVQDVWADRFDLENPDRDVEREVIRDPAPMAKVDDIKKTLEDIENVLNKRRGLARWVSIGLHHKRHVDPSRAHTWRSGRRLWHALKGS